VAPPKQLISQPIGIDYARTTKTKAAEVYTFSRCRKAVSVNRSSWCGGSSVSERSRDRIPRGKASSSLDHRFPQEIHRRLSRDPSSHCETQGPGTKGITTTSCGFERSEPQPLVVPQVTQNATNSPYFDPQDSC
jgi:hypothetical protein